MLNGEPNPPQRQGPRTALKTIRIPDEIDDQLKRIAEDEGISFNSLVNRMMRKFVDFDQYAEKLRLVTLPRQTVRGVVQSLDEQMLETKARELGERVPKEVIFYMHKERNFRVFLRYLEDISRYFRIGELETKQGDRTLTVALHHDMGMRWSTFLEGYISGGAKEVTGIEPVCEANEDMVVFRFEGVPEAQLRPTHVRPVASRGGLQRR